MVGEGVGATERGASPRRSRACAGPPPAAGEVILRGPLCLSWSLIKQFIPIPRAYICNQIIITRSIVKYTIILKIFGILCVNIL
jgi:hypothetical protein